MANKDFRTFEVVRTPKLRDSEGNYVARGQTCRLTQELAEHYHKLGYIRVTMDDLFKHADTEQRPDPSATSSPPSGGPDSIVSDSTVGDDDEEETSDHVENDIGVSETEASSRPTINSRRKRATS